MIATIDWKEFTGDEILLPVCFRSPAVKTRGFEATCRALGERVRRVHVIMCDTLDRYNVPEIEARRLSAEWQAAHLPILARHVPRHDVRLWDEVRAAPSFPERHAAMRALYAKSNGARDIVDGIVGYHLAAKAERRVRKAPSFDGEQERLNSTSYLIEEFAGTAEYASWFPGLPEAYWGAYLDDPRALGDERLVLPVTLPITIEGLPPPVGQSGGTFDTHRARDPRRAR